MFWPFRHFRQNQPTMSISRSEMNTGEVVLLSLRERVTLWQFRRVRENDASVTISRSEMNTGDEVAQHRYRAGSCRGGPK
jgi:hypothetical protein